MGTHNWKVWFLLFVFIFHKAELTATQKSCQVANGGCWHFCEQGEDGAVCSCADGYAVGEDGASCIATGDYPCGKIKETKTKREAIVLEYNDSVPFDYADYDNQTFTASPNDTSLNRTEVIIPAKYCNLGECPWQASLLDKSGYYFCGGTILDQIYVLTAASCVAEQNLGGVVIGTLDKKEHRRNRTLHTVANIYVHAKYNSISSDSDIALIELRKPIQFTENVIPACLPAPDFTDQILTNHSIGIVTGFGSTGPGRPVSSKLQLLRLPYIDNQRCNQSYSFMITENMFCAGYDGPGLDACKGFGGSPYLTEYRGTYFVTGIVSWGERCGTPGKYGVYTKVSNFRPWLRRIMHPKSPEN